MFPERKENEQNFTITKDRGGIQAAGPLEPYGQRQLYLPEQAPVPSLCPWQ